MKNILRGASALAIATVSILALSACDDIVVESANGSGTCGGNAVTLTTSQNDSGDNVTISYTGPSVSNVGLFLAQGFYTDEPLLVSGNNVNSLAAGNGSDAYGLKLDVTAPGWSTSGSGNNTSYSFSGSIQTLLNNATSPIGTDGTIPPNILSMFDSTSPVFIGVDCDASHTSGVVTTSWEVASSIYPNHLLINALEVVSSEAITNGASVTFRYPADALSSFGSFTPIEPFYLGFFTDSPDIENDSIGNFWAQAFIGSGSSSGSASPVANNDGTFTIEFTGSGGPLADGDYLLASFVPNDSMSEFKVVFSSLQYSAANGFALRSLGFLPEIPTSGETSEPTLPDTGVSGVQVSLIAGAGAVLALSGIALLAIRRRQNG